MTSKIDLASATTPESDIRLYAQPYDITATGFFFSSAEEYDAKRATCRNDFGQLVEEFEIQFIDGDTIDAQLFDAIGLHQGNALTLLEKASEWTVDEKIRIIIATGECGYTFNPETDDPEEFDITLYELDSLRYLAIEFVEEGLFGTIADTIINYLDYDAIARDLGMDYAETSIAGRHFIYRCA